MQQARWKMIAWCAAMWFGPLLCGGGLATASAAAIEQAVAPAVTAAVIADAPIYLKVGMTTPLRVAAAGTTLRVLSESGEWTQVQFQDPQFGLRTGWVASKLIRKAQPDLEPMDLSIPKALDRPPAARTRSRASHADDAAGRRGGAAPGGRLVQRGFRVRLDQGARTALAVTPD